MTTTEGTLALVGGGEWRDGCRDFDAELLEASGGSEVAVLPTAAAYEHPGRAVDWATAYFEGLGATVRPVMVLGRVDAEADEHARTIRGSRFVYLGGGSPLHLRSVLKGSRVWEALVEAWRDGAVVAGSSAGAMVLGDPMVDPRGGAFTLGLGLVENLAVLPHHDAGSAERVHRTLALASKGVAVVGLPEQTAVVLSPRQPWRAVGVGPVTIWVDGQERDLSALPS